MGRIEAYDADQMDAILNETVQNATISAGSLRAHRQDGSMDILGPCLGPTGPPGPIGGGVDDLLAEFADVIPGPWVSANIDSALWETYGGPYSGLRYRLIGDIVQMNGLIRWIGSSGSVTDPVVSTSFQAEALPSDGSWRTIPVNRNGRRLGFGLVAFLGVGYIVLNFPGGGTMTTGDWIAFGPGCSWSNM